MDGQQPSPTSIKWHPKWAEASPFALSCVGYALIAFAVGVCGVLAWLVWSLIALLF